MDKCPLRRRRSASLLTLFAAVALSCSDGGASAPLGDSSVAAADDATADATADVIGDAGLGDDGASADGEAAGDGDGHGGDSGDDGGPGDDAGDVAEAIPCDALGTSGMAKALEPLPKADHVLDNTGAAVDVASLQGHWTVVWFYPAAQTAG
jgi:hypothetical protein